MGVSKIVQTEVTVVCLVVVGNDWRMFSWRPPLPNQSLGRTTAECYFQTIVAWFEALDLSEIEKAFCRRHVLYCTDREGAQAKGQRCHSRAREAKDENTATTITPCDVHIKNSNREQAFLPEDQTTTRIKQCILSMNFSNHVRLFRVALRRVLLLLDRDDGPPPLGARVVN